MRLHQCLTILSGCLARLPRACVPGGVRSKKAIRTSLFLSDGARQRTSSTRFHTQRLSGSSLTWQILACVCVYYCRTYYKAVRGGGRRRVEDMCYERRRAEACVDKSAHHALANEGGREIVGKKEGEQKGSARGSVRWGCYYATALDIEVTPYT